MTIRDWNFALKALGSGGDWEAYVGLCEEDGQVTLRLPHGYREDVAESEKPRILGELMRAVARFSEAFPDVERSCYEGRSTRDGFLRGSGGQPFRFDHDGADVGYSNLSRYIKLIRRLRDPRLLALVKAPGLTAQFDHRYISRNLERAVYLPDGTPLFDHLWAPRAQMRHTGNDMVGLACWMALDGLNHLFPDSAGHEVSAALQSEWEELAYRFEDEHELDADASLFSGKRKDTLPLLQTALETCVRLAPPISSGANELHHLLDELLHNALSGQGGDIWGLRGFHHVWESACLEYAAQEYGQDNIFTCDQNHWLGHAPEKWIKNWASVFKEKGLERRPDLVVKKGNGTYLIVDFKYYAADEAKNKFLGKNPPSSPDLEWLKTEPAKFGRQWKPYQDIASVEAYRWRLMQYGLKSSDASKVEIELWVPDMNESRYPCEWMDGLTLVVKPAREILGAYAKKFRLMD